MFNQLNLELSLHKKRKTQFTIQKANVQKQIHADTILNSHWYDLLMRLLYICSIPVNLYNKKKRSINFIFHYLSCTDF